jgi:hypothetical protein
VLYAMAALRLLAESVCWFWLDYLDLDAAGFLLMSWCILVIHKK